MYYFYFQQEEMLNALETTLLLGVKFESNKVMDVLLLKLIKIITADDERKLSLAIVDSTNQIRAKSKCDFKLEHIHSRQCN